MPSVRHKKICKICPKEKKRDEIPKPVEPEKEPEVEEEEEEELYPEDEPVKEDPCIDQDGYGDFDLVTSDHVLAETSSAGRKKRIPFFAPNSETTRFDNLVPEDVSNDDQYEAAGQRDPLLQMSRLRVTSEPRKMRLPAIMGTITPANSSLEMIEDLLEAGMNIARINLAYGDRCTHLATISNLREAEKRFHARTGFRNPLTVMLDLKGSGISTGKICKFYIEDCDNPRIFLPKDRVLKLTTDRKVAERCTPVMVFVDSSEIVNLVRPGMKIMLDDGAVKLVVQKADHQDVHCIVEEEGYLGNNRNVILPMMPSTLPSYTGRDLDDIEMAIHQEVDAIALPRTHSRSAVRDIREILTEKALTVRKRKERPIMIFSKISTYEGLAHIDGLIDESDGIIVHRRDLGNELPPEKFFVAERQIIAKCNIAGKPVICSTQYLHSMLNKIQIGNSDIADIAASVRDGADCIGLTYETAVGKYAIQSIEMVGRVIREADAATYRRHCLARHSRRITTDLKVAVAGAAATIADKIRSPAIVVLTTSGKSAMIISQLRPKAAVIAVTAHERTARQLNFWRCITPLYCVLPCPVDWFMDAEKRFQYAIAYGKHFGIIRAGDPIVLVSPFGKGVGITNCVRIVYASTHPDVYLEHSKEFYSNWHLKQNSRGAPVVCNPKSIHGSIHHY
ncbi:UNVERIFIED_CONTAM: hypothetical protein PYX00_001174 [Menopon gallinae]|uniref:Pyruvate kinase n=1 Tax=Menopon gallinae TaxID=328185 RepID=A0AAW2IBW7_9NEOP